VIDARRGAFRLFRFAGIDVYLSWYWFIVAVIEIADRSTAYSSPVWNAAEYFALFLIVLLHEFGHALACRQVGGAANQIVLWPLGGVAYVSPPPRPGATLWSIAAGPLVNVVLLPILFALDAASHGLASSASPDVALLVRNIFYINIGLLLFNLLPIYPLDGGQILRSLLWFVLGRARSLMVATILGFLGTAGLVVLAIRWQSIWFGLIALYAGSRCVTAFRAARSLSAIEKSPRRHEFICPACKASPQVGDFWKCGRCGAMFDTFQTQAVCPACQSQFSGSQCLDCGRQSPMAQWAGGPVISSAPL